MAERPAAAAFLGTWLLAAFTLASPALAHARHHGHTHSGSHSHHRRYASAAGAHVIQCVAFARSDSGVQLSGNAANWWDNAAGVYARGNAPEVGSVLNFRATARMRLGHVAVVTDVVNSREVTIDQSHWNRNGVSRDISVIDVSPDNDWSAVRVALGHGDSYGSIYPTYGFIYARPDNGVMVANAASDTPMIMTANAAPSRLRPLGHHRHEATLEVAEAPEVARPIDLTVGGGATITDDAPNRAFR